MDKDREQKHSCKFCNKSFPCGRSLGGHMRSHLINISSADHQKTDEKLPKKKLPPLVNGKINSKTDFSMDGGGQFGYGLRENPKKTSRFSKSGEEDTLLQEKACKECGKIFQSWKALFGHMKCHSVNGRMTNSAEEDSWNSCNDYHKLIMDSQSDNEAATPPCRRKRSDRMKRYTANTNSSSLTIANFSPSVSEIDQQEQEEVALSLIILSRDKGDWGRINSVVESSDNSSEFVEAKKSGKTLDFDSKSNGSEPLKFRKLRNVKQLELKSLSVPRNGMKTRKIEVSDDDEFHTECNESEVNSPRNLIRENGLDQFETESNKKKSRKRKSTDGHDSGLSMPVAYKKLPLSSDSQRCQDFEKTSKFTCSICKKAFPSYHALGGHRASHKKFKGCCAPRSENSLETENSHNQGENLIDDFAEKAEVELKRSKEHECPICFKVFPSGQALGGHKRSHLLGDQAKNNASIETEKPIREIRDLLDLNLPAPAEEECNEFKPWWIGTSHKQQPPLLGLLSG